MLLTISTNGQPATDLGFLLHKHPDRAQSFDLAFGKVHVFYPEATVERCTAALLLDIDPIELVRGKGGNRERQWSLEQYVNDRPYVASSFLSVAISQVLRTALAGRCELRPDLVDRALPLMVQLSAVPCRGRSTLLADLFTPLGYQISQSLALAEWRLKLERPTTDDLVKLIQGSLTYPDRRLEGYDAAKLKRTCDSLISESRYPVRK
jgi:3' terminal RNA ribose 2'-O-methyltransferase Hen1